MYRPTIIPPFAELRPRLSKRFNVRPLGQLVLEAQELDRTDQDEYALKLLRMRSQGLLLEEVAISEGSSVNNVGKTISRFYRRIGAHGVAHALRICFNADYLAANTHPIARDTILPTHHNLLDVLSRGYSTKNVAAALDPTCSTRTISRQLSEIHLRWDTTGPHDAITVAHAIGNIVPLGNSELAIARWQLDRQRKS
jgi:DNA-binding CsgD family transcriptional regulator